MNISKSSEYDDFCVAKRYFYFHVFFMWRFHKKGIKLHFFVSGSLLDGKQRHRLVHVLGHVLGMQSLLDRLVEELLGAQAMVARSRQILERVLQQKGNDVLDRIQFASDEAYYQFGVFGKLSGLTGFASSGWGGALILVFASRNFFFLFYLNRRRRNETWKNF